jgi:type IV pilus assembly protein PilE
LIELMVAVAIVGILAAIAIPSYSSYVLRSHLVSATDQLSNSRALMEQYFQDNRQYTAVSATVTPPCATVVLTGDGYFDVSCTGANAALTATTYTIVATGVAATSVANFVYTVAQDGTIATLNLGSWGAAPAAHACWIVKQGQTC